MYQLSTGSAYIPFILMKELGMDFYIKICLKHSIYIYTYWSTLGWQSNNTRKSLINIYDLYFEKFLPTFLRQKIRRKLITNPTFLCSLTKFKLWNNFFKKILVLHILVSFCSLPETFIEKIIQTDNNCMISLLICFR